MDIKIGDIVAFTINDNSGRGGFGVVTHIGRRYIPYPIEIRFIATDWTRDSNGLITKNEITQVISRVSHERG